MALPKDDTDIIQPTRKREVAYGIVPLMCVRPTIYSLLSILTVFGLVMALIVATTSGMRVAPAINAGFALIMGSIAFGSTLGPMISDRWKNHKSLLQLDSRVSENDTVNLRFVSNIFEVNDASPIIRRKKPDRWSWHALAKACTASEVAIPSTIASRTHRQPLEAIPLEAAMLEPETILTSSTQVGPMSVLMVVFVIQGLIAAGNEEWFVLMISLVLFVSFAVQIPVFRDLIPALRPEGSAPIAGMGFIEDSKGKLWTVDDSLMILSGRKSGDKPVYVHIVGPAGWLLLTYASVKDPEFIKLWQRWNHPDPRPELAPLASA